MSIMLEATPLNLATELDIILVLRYQHRNQDSTKASLGDKSIANSKRTKISFTSISLSCTSLFLVAGYWATLCHSL